MALASQHLAADQQLIEQIQALLEDPAQQDNPMRAPLAELFTLCESQRERLERLIRISDGYHRASREQMGTLAERYDRQLHRMEKLARISDRYQDSLRQLNESLKEAALHDPLTGMGNRRYLMERLKAEAERALRKDTAFSLVILDVDHFKAVNDTYGHETGDQLLCEIARIIPLSMRDYDVCGRWGGEEFLLIFPETSVETAAPIAERVREAIKQITLPSLAGKHPVSASLGMTNYIPGERYDDAISRADDAMYQAKQSGRDQLQII